METKGTGKKVKEKSIIKAKKKIKSQDKKKDKEVKDKDLNKVIEESKVTA